MKASTLCAGSAILVLGGFMTINLAGCGGGGGGGNSIGSPTATPLPQTITFDLLLQNGKASSGGSIVLKSSTGTTYTGTAAADGTVSLPTIPKGTYTATFTTINDEGTPSTTTATVTIGSTSGQTFVLVDGVTNSTTKGALKITGTIRLNPVGVDDPDSDSSTANCTSSSTPLTDALEITVVDLDSSQGRVVVAQLARPAQSASNKGAYTIYLPIKPSIFRVEVSQTDQSGARYAGQSAKTNSTASTTINGTPTVQNVDICVNNDGTVPGPAVTPTPQLSAIPTLTATALTTPLTTPTSGATSTPVATDTPSSTSTPTGGTPAPGSTSTPTPTATTIATAGP